MDQHTKNNTTSTKERLQTTAFQAIRFAMVGIIAAAIHYGVYLLLLPYFSETIAYTIGYVVSFVCNFVLTCIFTFRKKASTMRGLGFCCAHLINCCLQVTLLKFFTWIGVTNTFAPIPVYCIAVPVNFILVRYVFQKHWKNETK